MIFNYLSESLKDLRPNIDESIYNEQLNGDKNNMRRSWPLNRLLLLMRSITHEFIHPCFHTCFLRRQILTVIECFAIAFGIISKSISLVD